MRIAKQSALAAECHYHLERIDDAVSGIEHECDEADVDVFTEVADIENATNAIDKILDRECHETPLEWLERTWRPA